MSRENVSDINNRIGSLLESTDRLYSQISVHEDCIFSGQDDPRHVYSIRDCYKQIEQNAFERGKLEAKLEMMHERSEDRSDYNQSKDDEKSLSQIKRESSENWWRPSQADERPEPSPEDDRDDGRYRR